MKSPFGFNGRGVEFVTSQRKAAKRSMTLTMMGDSAGGTPQKKELSSDSPAVESSVFAGAVNKPHFLRIALLRSGDYSPATAAKETKSQIP